MGAVPNQLAKRLCKSLFQIALACIDQLRSSSRRNRTSVRCLVIVPCVLVRKEYRRQLEAGQFGERRSSGPADDQACLWIERREITEKRLHIRFDLEALPSRRRALVVILSDCFCDGAELRDALQHLRFQKHDLALFHLLDPLELAFEFDRPVRFVDMEGSQSIVTEPATVRAEYQAQLRRFLGRLRDDCHEFNADYRRVTLDQPYDQVLADFLAERARHATRS